MSPLPLTLALFRVLVRAFAAARLLIFAFALVLSAAFFAAGQAQAQSTAQSTVQSTAQSAQEDYTQGDRTQEYFIEKYGTQDDGADGAWEDNTDDARDEDEDVWEDDTWGDDSWEDGPRQGRANKTPIYIDHDDRSIPYSKLATGWAWGIRPMLSIGPQYSWFIQDGDPYNIGSLGPGFYLGFDFLVDIIKLTKKPIYNFPMYSGGLIVRYSRAFYVFSTENPEAEVSNVESTYDLTMIGLRLAFGQRVKAVIDDSIASMQLQGTAGVGACITYSQTKKFKDSALIDENRTSNVVPCIEAGFTAIMYNLERIALGIESSVVYFPSSIQNGIKSEYHNFALWTATSIGWIF